MSLFISIVAFAVCNVNPSILHMVHQAVFIINAAAVFALQVTCEGFRFPDTFHTAVAFNILNELIDAFQRFLSRVCQ